MKPISKEKEIDIVLLLIKSKSIKEVTKSLDFLQSSMNKMRRKYYSSLGLP